MPVFGSYFDFRTIVMEWSSIGMFDVILPMLLIFTIVYATLQRTKLLGQKKEIDAVVGLVISFFVMGNLEVSRFFLPLFSNAALGIAVLVVFLLLTGLIAGRPGKGWGTITLIGGISVFLWVMSRAADYFSGYGIIFSSMWWYQNSWWVIPLILVGVIIAVVVAPEKSAEEKAAEAAAHFKPFPWWYGEEKQP